MYIKVANVVSDVLRLQEDCYVNLVLRKDYNIYAGRKIESFGIPIFAIVDGISIEDFVI